MSFLVLADGALSELSEVFCFIMLLRDKELEVCFSFFFFFELQALNHKLDTFTTTFVSCLNFILEAKKKIISSLLIICSVKKIGQFIFY